MEEFFWVVFFKCEDGFLSDAWFDTEEEALEYAGEGDEIWKTRKNAKTEC